MIEALMYFGIGFLLAALSVLVVTPLVHGRAVRLTTRRVKATLPQSFAEVVADKDLLRAEFAMSTRRLETNVEQLKTKSANQLAELGSKADAINRLKVEVGSLREQLRVTEEELAVKTSVTRDAQRLFEKDAELAKPKRSSIVDAQTVEIISLKTRIEALKEQLTAADSELKAEGDVIPVMPTAPMDSSQSPPSSDQHHEGDVTFLPKVSPTAGKVPISSQSPPPQRLEGDVTPLCRRFRRGRCRWTRRVHHRTSSVMKAMLPPLRRRFGQQPKKLNLAARRAIRMPDAMHPSNALEWLEKGLTFLLGYGQWNHRSACFLAPPALRTIRSPATGRRLAGEHSAPLLTFPLRP